MTTTVFLESLDSTRATSEDSVRHPNLAQTQTEALISLLLGRTVSVSGTYAFDSRSFLELAEVALDARAAAMDECPSGSPGRARLERAVPFQLNWYQANREVSDLRSACVEQLERPGFVLSAWRQINDDASARRALAAALRADHDAPPGLGHDLLRQFDTLRRILDYGESGGRTRQAGQPAVNLAKYLTFFAGLPQVEVELLAERSGCPAPLAMDLRDEIKARTGVLGSRSWAHDVILRAQRYVDPTPSLPLLVRELVDTCYNAVMADSCGAATGYMSSVPRVDGRTELKYVNLLATSLIELCRAQVSKAELKPSPISGLLARAEVVRQVDPKPLRLLFDAHWRLIADDETHRLWSDSSAELEEQLDPDAGHGAALEEAWASHLDLLRLRIDGLLVDGSTMAVGAEHRGVSYAQTHRLGRPPAEQLTAAYSVGEYLDELSMVGR